jgi:hypothetical protein
VNQRPKVLPQGVEEEAVPWDRREHTDCARKALDPTDALNLLFKAFDWVRQICSRDAEMFFEASNMLEI